MSVENNDFSFPNIMQIFYAIFRIPSRGRTMESVRDGLAKVCFTIVMRNQASVGGSSCSISSLKFVALSHQEQAAVFSLPCLDKTSGYRQNTSYASKLSAPHSQDSRLPPPETPNVEADLRVFIYSVLPCPAKSDKIPSCYPYHRMPPQQP